MRILFTGGSSFTGYWFVRELARRGHEVVAVLRQPVERYLEVRGARVQGLREACRLLPGVSFGDDTFLKLIADTPDWDLLCHHAADVSNYKSPDFDVTAALANNTQNLPAVLDALVNGGCRRVLLTGSVFEQGEGAGSQGLPAFSPYGVSKGLTADVFRYHCNLRGLRLGKFVIPNPFGPYEEPRFTTYLVRNWLAGKTPAVNTPAYVRDNIHVSLLARSYAQFAEGLPAQAGYEKFNPSGYVETQGAFTARFSAALEPRLGVACRFELKKQTDFSEPHTRLNTDWPNAAALEWDEAAAWDELAGYYRDHIQP